MPKIVLASHLVAYNLFTKCNTADPQVPRSVRGLQVQVPDSSIESANSGATVQIGRPNSIVTPTSIASPEMSLLEAQTDGYPQSDVNNISLVDKWVQASVDNCVLYVNPEVA